MSVRGEINDEQVIAAFERAARAGVQPQRMLGDIGRYGVSSTRLRFRNQVDPDGVKWTPSRRAKEQGGQTLRDTSRLRNSITFNVTAEGVEWGTNVKYAGANQDGVNKVVKVTSFRRRSTRFGYKADSINTKSGFSIPIQRRVRVSGSGGGVRSHNRKMNLPRRAFLGVNAADKSAILYILREHLVRAPFGL